MSRIGRMPITIPNGVSVIVENNVITAKGPLGTLSQEFSGVNVNVEGDTITITRPNDTKELKSKHGLYRSLIANIVLGVSELYTKTLEIKGVGYRATKSGNKLVLSLGFSHPIEVIEPDGIKIECPTNTEIKISGIDKQKVGQVASSIKDFRPVEPYHGYGVRYKGEHVIRKQGKTAGKGKK